MVKIKNHNNKNPCNKIINNSYKKCLLINNNNNQKKMKADAEGLRGLNQL